MDIYQRRELDRIIARAKLDMQLDGAKGADYMNAAGFSTALALGRAGQFDPDFQRGFRAGYERGREDERREGEFRAQIGRGWANSQMRAAGFAGAYG